MTDEMEEAASRAAEKFSEKLQETLVQQSPSPSQQEALQSTAAKVWKDIEEPFIIILAHGLIILFGVGLLSLLSWVIDIAHMSDTAKAVMHVIDEYLMVFSFIILGIAFIIKIVLVVLGAGKRHE